MRDDDQEEHIYQRVQALEGRDGLVYGDGQAYLYRDVEVDGNVVEVHQLGRVIRYEFRIQWDEEGYSPDPRKPNVDQVASERAQALLLRYLSFEQRQEYYEHKHFTVRGSAGGSYRIHYPERQTMLYNVERLDPENIDLREYAPSYHASERARVWLGLYLPVPGVSGLPQYNMYAAGDRMLAQKLRLECFENDVWLMACKVDRAHRDSAACGAEYERPIR